MPAPPADAAKPNAGAPTDRSTHVELPDRDAFRERPEPADSVCFDEGDLVISEPEMAGEPEPGRPGDVLSGGDTRPRGALRRRPWWWGLGGAVTACAVWAGVLQGTGYGRHHDPDLHGLHFHDDLCVTFNLEPLIDSLPPDGFGDGRPAVTRAPALDHLSCAMAFSPADASGWSTAYLVQLTVDLHHTTDPRAEFTALYDPVVASPTLPVVGGTEFGYGTGDFPPTSYPGLGDLAYASRGASHEALSVLYGGAVISLSLDATPRWTGTGQAPAQSPDLPDISALRPLLPRTIRHLMTVLATP